MSGFLRPQDPLPPHTYWYLDVPHAAHKESEAGVKRTVLLFILSIPLPPTRGPFLTNVVVSPECQARCLGVVHQILLFRS